MMKYLIDQVPMKKIIRKRQVKNISDLKADIVSIVHFLSGAPVALVRTFDAIDFFDMVSDFVKIRTRAEV